MSILMESVVAIKSDFTDYYDNLADPASLRVYNRMESGALSQTKSLNKLRSLGIKCIELKPLSEFVKQEYPLVVCNGNNKKIVNYNEGINYYSNSLAYRYYGSDNNEIVKYIQLGSRRFNVRYNDKQEVIDVKENDRGYNNQINLPIFSIDYTQIDNTMVAVDFHEVENFNKIGLKDFIPAQDVIDELSKALDR